MQNSIIIVLENIDQLDTNALKFLMEAINSLKNHMLPRLLLCSTTLNIINTSSGANIFTEKIVTDIGSHKLSTLTLRRDESLSITSSSSPHMKRLSSMRRRQSTPKPKTLADALLNATILNEGQITELSFACVGIAARETIEEAVAKCQAEASWIYLDDFTGDQLISQSSFLT